MKSAPIPLLALFLTGCLGVSAPLPVNWTITPAPGKILRSPSPKFNGVARLTSLTVRPPFDRPQLAVLRADGSIAFDGYNVFASSPAAIFRGTALDILGESAVFRRVVPSMSGAAAQYSIEVDVAELALDCRATGERRATVKLSLAILENRMVIASTTATASVPAANGNYSAAFSAAFTDALSEALSKIR